MPRNNDKLNGKELVPVRPADEAGEKRPARRRKDTDEMVPPALLLQEASPFQVRKGVQLSPHRSLCLARRPESAASQQYRMVLFKLRDSGAPRLIGITSAAQGEGKTTVAANLALAHAEGRQAKVMLLDLNLRAPALGRRFGLTLFGSLADQLRLKQRRKDARWETIELRPGLHMMAGGEPTENPSPLLNSPQMGTLINDLAAHYDHVIVDLPAVLAAADAGSVQDYLDAMVLVCRAGHSRRTQLRHAVERLGTRRLHGVLMLDVEGRLLAH